MENNLLRYFATVITLLLLASLAQAEEIAVFPERITVQVVDETGEPITHAVGIGSGIDSRMRGARNGVIEISIDTERLRRGLPVKFNIMARGYNSFTGTFDTNTPFTNH